MSTYFETHAQKLNQWGRTRRNGAKPSGVIVIHTAESATDFSGADSGAENVARYFTQATRYASYHAICDADTTIQLVPWASEAWHDTGTNNHSVGISGAIQCKDWDELGDRGKLIVRRMAAAAADYATWLKATRGITIPAHKITREQSRNKVPGFLAHGTSDPGRRSDPGAQFDWDLFFREFKAALGQDEGVVEPKPTPPKPAAKKDSAAHRTYNPGEVKAIQAALNRAGYDAGPEDDDYGNRTETAVRSYQDAQLWPLGNRALKADGDWGPGTQAHYEWTRRLQNALNRWASVSPDLTVDGDHRSRTRRAVGQIQQANLKGAYRKAGGRAVDSEPGPITCRMLNMPEHP